MNRISLESFIDFCDDMEIVEEGFFDRFKRKKIENKSSASLSTEVSANLTPECEDTINEMTEDVINHLKQYSSSSAFKKKYKLYTRLVYIYDNSNKRGTSVIQVTNHEHGIDEESAEEWTRTHESEEDNPYYDNKWFFDLNDEGIEYLKKKYSSKMKEFGIDVYQSEHFDEPLIIECK